MHHLTRPDDQGRGMRGCRGEVKEEGATARVEKHMVADPERRIGRLVGTVTLPSGLPPAAHAALEQAARNCPVHHTLHPDTEVELCFETAERPVSEVHRIQRRSPDTGH